MPCTTSWTASKSATKRLRRLTLILLALGSVECFGAGCGELWTQSRSGKVVASQRPLLELLGTRRVASPWRQRVRAAISPWSADLLIDAVNDLEQSVLSQCRSTVYHAFTAELKQEYVRRLGVQPTLDSVDTWYQATVANEASRKDLQAEIHRYNSKGKELQAESALVAVGRLYRTAEQIRGVLVVGAAPSAIESLRITVHALCGRARACRFWDSRFLRRVMVLPQSGVAAYSAEIGVLQISAVALSNYTDLHRFVLIHELAHVAIQYELRIAQHDWVAEFSAFSGWKKTEAGFRSPVRPAGEVEWGDILSTQSKQSSFPLEPDPVSVAREVAGKKLDGFVVAKASRETEKSDPSEDLADHIAAFIAAPQRYCFGGEPVAPRKYAWIGNKVFGRDVTLKCASLK